jgi:hypothetical protein
MKSLIVLSAFILSSTAFAQVPAKSPAPATPEIKMPAKGVPTNLNPLREIKKKKPAKHKSSKKIVKKKHK